MGTRGRTSADALSVIQTGVEVVPRADAPYELTDEEADIWRAVVNTMPADWFMPANHPNLVQYCRHIVAARQVAQLIQQELKQKTLNVENFMEFLKRQKEETAAINALSRSMRLTQQSVMRAETAKHPKQVGKPWDDR